MGLSCRISHNQVRMNVGGVDPDASASRSSDDPPGQRVITLGRPVVTLGCPSVPPGGWFVIVILIGVGDLRLLLPLRGFLQCFEVSIENKVQLRTYTLYVTFQGFDPGLSGRGSRGVLLCRVLLRLRLCQPHTPCF